jgi:ribosomal protein S7
MDDAPITKRLRDIVKGLDYACMSCSARLVEKAIDHIEKLENKLRLAEKRIEVLEDAVHELTPRNPTD